MQPYFTGQAIQQPQINMDVATMPGRMIGQAMANLGETVAVAIKEKKEKEQKKAEQKMLSAGLQKHFNLPTELAEGVAANPQVLGAVSQLEIAAQKQQELELAREQQQQWAKWVASQRGDKVATTAPQTQTAPIQTQQVVAPQETVIQELIPQAQDTDIPYLPSSLRGVPTPTQQAVTVPQEIIGKDVIAPKEKAKVKPQVTQPQRDLTVQQQPDVTPLEVGDPGTRSFEYKNAQAHGATAAQARQYASTFPEGLEPHEMQEYKEERQLRKKKFEELDRNEKKYYTDLRRQEIEDKRQIKEWEREDEEWERKRGQLNESEKKAIYNTRRLVVIEKRLDDIEKYEKYDYDEQGGLKGLWDQKVPNAIKTDVGQRFWQLADNWVNAVIRYESGANIPHHEIETVRQLYFPMFGDTKETIELKKELRKVVQDGIRAGIPNIYKEGSDVQTTLNRMKTIKAHNKGLLEKMSKDSMPIFNRDGWVVGELPRNNDQAWAEFISDPVTLEKGLFVQDENYWAESADVYDFYNIKRPNAK